MLTARFGAWASRVCDVLGFLVSVLFVMEVVAAEARSSDVGGQSLAARCNRFILKFLLTIANLGLGVMLGVSVYHWRELNTALADFAWAMAFLTMVIAAYAWSRFCVAVRLEWLADRLTWKSACALLAVLFVLDSIGGELLADKEDFASVGDAAITAAATLVFAGLGRLAELLVNRQGSRQAPGANPQSQIA